MLRRFRRILTAFVVVLLADPAGADSSAIGKLAPDFSATTLDGRELALADFKGQVLIVNFWATWCAPCKQELPLLEGYYRVQGKNGLRIIVVATERSVSPARLSPIAAQLTVSMIRRFEGRYPVLGGMPTNYVIDRNGVVRYARAGAFTLDTLNAVLVPLLNEPGH